MIKTNSTGVYYRISKDKTKTFYIQYKHHGKLIRKKVGAVKEGINIAYCTKLRNEILVKLRLGESAPLQNVKTLSFAEVTTEYFDSLEDSRSSKTKMKAMAKMHLSSLAGERIDNINDDTIKKLRRDKSKEVSILTKRVLSEGTVSNIVLLLSAIMSFAEKKKYISEKPTFKEYLPKLNNERTRFLSTSEVNLLLQTIKKSELRAKDELELFVRVSLITGGRISSVTNVKGKDINRTNCTVELHNFKTKKWYTAFLSKSIMDQIPPLDVQQKLFDITLNKQIQRPLQGILNQLFNVGLNADDRKDRVVIHTLRHTFASHLAINGTPIFTIMKRMDHSNIEMTLKYAKLSPDAGRLDVENLYG